MRVKKILVVDDSQTDRFYLGDFLAKKGYQIIYANSGDEAIAKAVQEHPDLVLMDIVMPGLDGFRATRALVQSEITAHIPIILCTAKQLDTDRQWGMRQGACGYLTKPVNHDELLQKIAEIG